MGFGPLFPHMYCCFLIPSSYGRTHLYVWALKGKYTGIYIRTGIYLKSILRVLYIFMLYRICTSTSAYREELLRSCLQLTEVKVRFP